MNSWRARDRQGEKHGRLDKTRQGRSRRGRAGRMFMPKNHLFVICLTVTCIGPSAAAAGGDLIRHDAASSAGRAPTVLAAAELNKGGPTPYPKNESDWPGVGVIRVFGFMTGERQLIWSQRQVNQGAVVFVGDSNIGEWKTLQDDFVPLHVANSGVGGDVSRGLLFRLKEDVIDLTPKAVVILIGSNDISATEDLSLLMSNLTSILKMLRDYNHSLPVVLCKLPPRGNVNPVYNRDVIDLNYRLDSLSKSDSKLALLDLYQLLALPDGSIDPQNFNDDKIHISLTGYKKFHDALILIFRRLQVE
jgi:lysophospholipase L1-like esterase